MRNTDSHVKSLFDISPTAVICFYQIDLKEKGKYFFHAGENGYRAKLIFNSQAYDFVPIYVEGFEVHGDGRLPRPKMTFSNHQGNMSLKLGFFKDFINYKVTSYYPMQYNIVIRFCIGVNSIRNVALRKGD